MVTIDTKQFFFQLSVIDVFDRIVDYHLGLSATAKDARVQTLKEGEVSSLG